MTLTAERRTRGEQIGDILTGLEHLWKMDPTHPFGELLRINLGSLDNLNDDEIEARIRERLRSIMSGSRDRT